MSKGWDLPGHGDGNLFRHPIVFGGSHVAPRQHKSFGNRLYTGRTAGLKYPDAVAARHAEIRKKGGDESVLAMPAAATMVKKPGEAKWISVNDPAPERVGEPPKCPNGTSSVEVFPQ